MQPAEIVARLAADAQVFRHLLAGVSADQARWKPAAEKWSLVEVVCHLADEEREDFRTRLALLIERPGEPWPAIDPLGWAAERRYDERGLQDALAVFLAERARTLDWLQALPHLNLAAAYAHPSLGRLSAGDLLASWIAHDLIHIRQMTRLHYEYLAAKAGPYSPSYAGPW